MQGSQGFSLWAFPCIIAHKVGSSLMARSPVRDGGGGPLRSISSSNASQKSSCSSSSSGPYVDLQKVQVVSSSLQT